MKSEFEKHADAVDTAVLFFQVVCAIVSLYVRLHKPHFFKIISSDELVNTLQVFRDMKLPLE